MGGLCNHDTTNNKIEMNMAKEKSSEIRPSRGGRQTVENTNSNLNDFFRGDEIIMREQENSTRINKVKEFKILLFEQINLCRTDPKKFSELVESSINLIKYDEVSKKYFFDRSESFDDKIYLKKGPQMYKDSVNYLKGIYPLPPLVYKEDLEIPVDSNPANWTKREKLTEILEKKTNDMESLYSGFSFHFDVNIRNPELSIVVQVVDDGPFFGQRRNNILSHQLKYVGISHSELDIKDKICLYFNFAY